MVLCNVNGNIKIGNDTELKSHVSITGKTTIGKIIFLSFFEYWLWPQDLKFKGEESELIIGDNNIFRENVTVSKGTLEGNENHYPNDNLFMTGVHVAHDCIITIKISLLTKLH